MSNPQPMTIGEIRQTALQLYNEGHRTEWYQRLVPSRSKKAKDGHVKVKAVRAVTPGKGVYPQLFMEKLGLSHGNAVMVAHCIDAWCLNGVEVGTFVEL